MKNNPEKINKIRKLIDRVYKVALVLTIVIFIILFSYFYSISKYSLISLQDSEVQSLNKDVTYILENRRQKIAENAMILEKYMAEGKSNDEILTYLRMEHTVMSTLDSEYSDVYGYINGEYLDGSGWDPDENFIPKERPWYIAGVESAGKVAFASPYIDAITGNLIISYSKLLSDGESVISYDIQLSNMQKLVNDTVSDKLLETIIFDENETILADSQNENISLHFNELEDDYYKTLYENYIKSPNNDYEFYYGRNSYYVFNTSVTAGMKQLMIVDAQQMFAPLRKATVSGTIILIIVIVLVALIIHDISIRRRTAESDLTQIKELYREANTDRLTGLFNRRAYEDGLVQIQSDGISDDFVYISFDLNRLKYTNDTKGHSTGDKLLCGAASVITDVWGSYGKVYRIGGDEFSAILELDSEQISSLCEKFAQKMLNWSRENDIELSISYGIFTRKENVSASIPELISIADEKMYIDKTTYYKSSGNDRRKS